MEDLLTKLSSVQQNLKAPKGQRNNFGNYNYRSAEDILEAVKPLLFEAGIVMTISDSIVNHGDRYYVEATVTVQNGTDSLQATGMAREAETKKGMDEAQITGAASSYARKYAPLMECSTLTILKTLTATNTANRLQLKPHKPRQHQSLMTSLLVRKKAINEKLESQGVTSIAAKKAKITSIISKSTIDTMADANNVMDALENLDSTEENNMSLYDIRQGATRLWTSIQAKSPIQLASMTYKWSTRKR